MATNDSQPRGQGSNGGCACRRRRTAGLLIGIAALCCVVSVVVRFRVAESEAPPRTDATAGASLSPEGDSATTSDDVKELWKRIRAGELDAVRVLVEASPKLARATDKHGKTALHIASRHEKIAAYLLSKGSDANAKDSVFEETPLHWAVRANRPAVVKALLEHGARVSEKSKKGDTALSIARRLHMKRLIAILEEAVEREGAGSDSEPDPEPGSDSDR